MTWLCMGNARTLCTDLSTDGIKLYIYARCHNSEGGVCSERGGERSEGVCGEGDVVKRWCDEGGCGSHIPSSTETSASHCSGQYASYWNAFLLLGGIVSK